VSSSRRLVVVTNIPSPYRLHFFEHLNAELHRRGIELEVLFMAETERGRHWQFSPQHWTFPHRVAWGIHPYLGDAPMHLNPGILMDVLRHPPDWLLVGGGWAMPTASLLVLVRPFLRKCTVVWWGEFNEQALRSRLWPIERMRTFVLRQADAFTATGAVARDFVHSVLGIVNDEVILACPNLVDEAVYGLAVDRKRQSRQELKARYRVKNQDILVLISARLVESRKGIINFLQAVKPLHGERFLVLVAGEGPDRPLIEHWLKASNFSQARLLGHQAQGEMVELLALADLFVLPSFWDANPLAAIEALWAGLPLLVSRTIGNCPEVLEPGKNGWSFDPHRPEEIRAAFEQALSLGPDGLRTLGHASRRLAEERFSTPVVVHRLVDGLISLRARDMQRKSRRLGRS